MKIYVLTEVDTANEGFSPKNVYTFETMRDARDKMVYLFNAKKIEWGINPAKYEDLHLESTWANIGSDYHLDIFETEPEHFERIMEATNSHNPVLTAQINILWNTKREEFGIILKALYKRDFRDIINDEIFAGLPADEAKAYSDLQINWESHAGDYLTFIADDSDLETIINFIR